jgi:transcriptional regulator with XRE-family HTH domain
MATQLKQWRLARNLTQEKAAELLAVCPRHYQRVEAGHRRLTPMLERLLELNK